MASPVPGAKERIEVMMRRFGELSDEVGRLEGLVEDQRRELEVQNSSRFGGMYDDGDEAVVTQSMVDQEEGQVHQLEDKIKAMQEKVHSPYSTPDVDLDCAIGWKDRFCIIGCIVWSLSLDFEYVQRVFPFHVNDPRIRLFMNQNLCRLCVLILCSTTAHQKSIWSSQISLCQSTSQNVHKFRYYHGSLSILCVQIAIGPK